MSSVNPDQLVIEEVRRHYEKSRSPYYLAVLGEFLRSQQIDIPAGVKLKDYVQDNFKDQLSIVQDRDMPAKIAVTLPDNQEHIRQQLVPRYLAATDNPAIDLDRLPFSLRVAFCIVPPVGTQVYFRTVGPFRYAFGSSAPDDTYIAIEDMYRPSGLRGSLVQNHSAEDKREVYQHIEKWANVKDIDLASIRYNTGSASFRPTNKLNPSATNALQRLVEAQDADLRNKILIPGDIAVALMRLL